MCFFIHKKTCQQFKIPKKNINQILILMSAWSEIMILLGESTDLIAAAWDIPNNDTNVIPPSWRAYNGPKIGPMHPKANWLALSSDNPLNLYI